MSRHRFTSVVLAGVMIALAGCGGNAATPQESASQSAPASEAAVSEAAVSEDVASEAAPVTLRAVLQLNPEIELENNPVIAEIEFEIEAPPQDGYGDRVKMLVSTGDMPDLVHYGADISATQWAQEGLLLDVTDLISKYPNLSANISEEQYGDCVFLADGRIYGIPRPNSYDKWGFVINKKWLDAVNMEAPKTVEQFVNVCRAFTFNDPDGNGRNDTRSSRLLIRAYGICRMISSQWHIQYPAGTWECLTRTEAQNCGPRKANILII